MSDRDGTTIAPIWFRLARWTTIAGLLAMGASMFLAWYEYASHVYVPVLELASARGHWIVSSTLWPFVLLVFYAFLGEAGGRRTRSAVTWMACLWLGLSALAMVCISLGGVLRALRIDGLDFVLKAVRNAPAVYVVYVLFAVGGFIFLAVPLFRPRRAALPACVGLCGFLGVASTAPSFTIFADIPEFCFHTGYGVYAASAFVVAAGGAWEFILQRRRGEIEGEHHERN